MVLIVSYCHAQSETHCFKGRMVSMSKCHHYQKHCAFTAVIALHRNWQAELSSSWVYLFSIWLWSHFQAGQSCTKTVCVPYYKDIWFSMKKNLNYVWGFSPPTASFQEKNARENAWRQTKTTVTGFSCQKLQPQSDCSSRASGEWVCVMEKERGEVTNFDIVLVTLCSFFI